MTYAMNGFGGCVACPECSSTLEKESGSDWFRCGSCRHRIVAGKYWDGLSAKSRETYSRAYEKAIEAPLGFDQARQIAEIVVAGQTSAEKVLESHVWWGSGGAAFVPEIDDRYLQNILNYIARNAGAIRTRGDWDSLLADYPSLNTLMLQARLRKTIEIPAEFRGGNTNWWAVNDPADELMQIVHTIAEERAMSTVKPDAASHPTVALAVDGAVAGAKMGGAVLGQRAVVGIGKKLAAEMGLSEEQLAILETPAGQALVNILLPLGIHGIAVSAPDIIPQSRFVAACADAAYRGNCVIFAVDNGQAAFDFAKKFAAELGQMAKAGAMLLGEDLPTTEIVGDTASVVEAVRGRRSAAK